MSSRTPASSWTRRYGIALAAGATLIASSCAALYPEFRAERSGAVQGYRCPPLKDYPDELLNGARAQVAPGSPADQLIDDYHLMRKLCRPDEGSP